MKRSKNKKLQQHICVLCLLYSLLCSVLCGCTSINKDTKIVLTTGFTEDEVFRIESASCYKKELMVYLTNIQNDYEKVYSGDIWEVEQNGISVADAVKETVLARLARIKTLNLMAENYGITLSSEEREMVDAAAETYYASLSEAEKKAMDVNEDTIWQLYMEYALSDKVYEHIIGDVNPEISDDEARTVSLQQILMKGTYARQRAEEVYHMAITGDAFEILMEQYNEADTGLLSVSKEDGRTDIEEVAFNLSAGEISKPFPVEEGYMILHCLSTLDREETEENKENIIRKRRQEVFTKEYDAFVEGLTRNMNEELWKQIDFIHDKEVKTDSFFVVYNQFIKL